MRRSTVYLAYAAINTAVLSLLLLFSPWFKADECSRRNAEGRELVRQLDLTDLCLFSEARYTRHISQADFHSAFQDHPMSMEHFPSGSLVVPPREAWSVHESQKLRPSSSKLANPPHSTGTSHDAMD